MGNQAGSLKKHLETAEKTGALNFTDQGLEKFPSDMSKVSFLINLMRQLQCCVFFTGWEELKKFGFIEKQDQQSTL